MTSKNVHLVGSLGLRGEVSDTFRALGEILDGRLKRVPDGEPGPRQSWMLWQYLMFRAHGALTPDEELGPINYPNHPMKGVMPMRLAEGVDPETLSFGELGYSREARTSYVDFVDARRKGELPSGARFQVSLPSPRIVVMGFCGGRDHEAILKAYQAAMVRELHILCQHIPHHDLCIQWDLPSETMVWDGRLPIPLDKQEVTQRLAGLCAELPADVEVGFHFCYGEPHKFRSLVPLDAGSMVAFANALVAATPRKINYIHMPVPADRTDEAFFSPLSGLQVGDTEIYLGMVHRDGDEPMRKRLAAASKYIQNFGVGTECGLGRRDVKDVEAYLTAYAHYADASA